MERSRYPVLAAAPERIHLDASAAFPAHEKVIEAVDMALRTIAGTPYKASYQWSYDARSIVEDTRQIVATLIGGDASDIHFSYSASDSAAILIRSVLRSCTIDTVLASREDHSSIVHALKGVSADIANYTYRQDGTYALPDTVIDSPHLLIMVSHMHHLYGRINDLTALRRRFPLAIIVVDASQSVGRTEIDVEVYHCDALFFSAQKIGGIAGVGVTFCRSPRLAEEMTEPHTLPLPAIAACRAAVQVLRERGVADLSLYLDRLSTQFIMDATRRIRGLRFSKGPAYSELSCSGNGIISFAVDGYSSADVAMILEESGVNVRAADHCVDAAAVDRDVVRVSMHGYTSEQDIARLVDILAQL